MSQPEGDQRLWYIVDELDALGAIDGLKDALARLRKFGGRCVLGMQSIAQVRACYGEADARTIIENCGTSLILRCSASEAGGTAQFASQLIGDRQVRRTRIQHPFRASGARRAWHPPPAHPRANPPSSPPCLARKSSSSRTSMDFSSSPRAPSGGACG